MYLNQYKQNINDSINNNNSGDNSQNNKSDDGNTTIIIIITIIIVIIIIIIFQSGDFSAGSTTDSIFVAKFLNVS